MSSTNEAPEVVPEHGLYPTYPYHDREMLQTHGDQGQGQGQYASPVPGRLPSPTKRKIMGMRRTTFVLVTTLVVVIIVAAIGGGVGGSIAVKNASNNSPGSGSGSTHTTSSSTPSPSSTTTSVYTAPTDVLVNTSCPAVDGKMQHVKIGAVITNFMPTCNTDMISGDLVSFFAYSLLDCMTACAMYNSRFGPNVCKAIVLQSNMTAARDAYSGANCFLKNATQDTTTNNDMVSAVLQ